MGGDGGGDGGGGADHRAKHWPTRLRRHVSAMHRAKSKARDALKSINVVPDLIKEITNTSRIHFETNFTFKVKRQSLLSRTLRSPYFGLLLICTFTFFYCAAVWGQLGTERQPLRRPARQRLSRYWRLHLST
jgi:hypothetical protein